MNRKFNMMILTGLFLFAMTFTPATTVAAAPTELTLGGLFPLTGGLAAGGVEREAAFRIAIEEINADDSLLADTELKYLVRDTQTDAAVGPVVAQELIDAGVFGLVGAASSGVSKAIATKAEAAKVPQISYSSTSPSLSDKDDFPYFLRVVPPDSVQGYAIAKIVESFSWDTVSTISTNDEYGQGGMGVFQDAAAELGITVVSPQEFAPNESDVKNQLQAIVDSGAKVIIINMIVADAVTVFSQAAAVGITGANGYAWIGTDGPTQTQVFENSTEVADAMNGMIGTRPNRGTGAIYDAFLDTWESKDSADYAGAGDREPNTYATFAYDAVYAFAHAAEQMIADGADPTDGEALLAVLKAIEFDGATGPVSFDKNSDRLGVYDIVNLQGTTAESLVTVGSWDEKNGMVLDDETPIIWGDGTTDIPAGGKIAPGFEFVAAFFALFVMIPILKKKKY